MKEGPDIARIATLIGDPARANMLTALMTGKALTATELAGEAGVTPATASSHLRKLSEADLIVQRPEGRHRYYTLTGEDVAATLEALMGLAAGRGHTRMRTGPKEPALRKARVCYNHLAGEMGVRMYRHMQAQGCFAPAPHGLDLTQNGKDMLAQIGLDVETLPRSNAPLCRECLDWSARTPHLAGRIGRGLLSHFLDIGWAQREANSRIVTFSPKGEAAFVQAFGPALTEL